MISIIAENNEQEIWKDVPEWEGFYQVSDFGRTRRIAPGRRTRIGRIHNLFPNKKGYLCTRFYINGKGKTVYVHRLVALTFLGRPLLRNTQVDHINGDRKDNRLCNLRYATNAQNQQNSSKRSNCSSKYKGVSWAANHERWHVSINDKYLGSYESEEDAARAYDLAAKEEYGEFARLNFGID